jgi:hypothetical protein
VSRHFKDWLAAFVQYASYGEAPRHTLFWAGVSTLAGALRRKVWIDQYYFSWTPNFYIVLVAPPGIISKTTTMDIGMDLLRKIPGTKMGPNIITWQSLVSAFAEAGESFLVGDEWHTMSPLTLASGEFGNLLNPQDRDMVDLLVTLWDGKAGVFEKRTKMSGNDKIVNPWINLLACTTPAWIAGNFPEYMIGGGFVSRTIFVFADKKAKYIAYPGLKVPKNIEEIASKLIEDLEHISLNLAGEYHLSADAIEWGEEWYKNHYENPNPRLDELRFGGYKARKQTHIHKLAMVLAASRRDELTITKQELIDAEKVVTELEESMTEVFSRIGTTDEAFHAQRLLNMIRLRNGIPYTEAYRLVHAHFPQARQFEEIVQGFVRSGELEVEATEGRLFLRPAK